MRRRVPGRKKVGMKPFTQIPTLEQLAAQPELAQTLSADATRKLWLQCVSVLNALSVPLTMNGHAASQEPIGHSPSPPEERWLSTEEVCARFGSAFSKRWLYDHQKQLGGKKLSRKKLVFNPKLIDNFLKRI